MRKSIATLTFLFVAVIVTFAQTKDEIAQKQFELKAYDKAIATCSELLKEKDQDADAVRRLAESYFFTNDMKNALVWYKKLDQMGVLKGDALLHYAKAHMRSGNYPQAAKLFERYAAENPKVGKHFAAIAAMAGEMATQPPLYTVRREYLNTKDADFLPTFFGNSVVYSSARTDIRRKMQTKSGENWEGKKRNQLFITKRDAKGFLQKPRLLMDDLSFKYNEGPVAYSGRADKLVVITKNQFVNGHSLEANLQSKMILLGANYAANGTWKKAKALPINDLEYSNGFPAFSPDGKTLYFSSNRPGGQGGYDIYVSKYENGSWSEPRNLGTPVNTPGDEITPFMDGEKLYFASNWLPGLGGFDIFRAEKDETYNTWAKVFNLGTGVNSSYDDYGFIYDAGKNLGYFTSNRRGPKSADDLFRVTKSSEKINIMVYDAESGTPLPGAMVDFSQCGEKTFKTNKKGLSSFQIIAGFDCKARIKKPGYEEKEIAVAYTGKKKSQQFVVKLPPAGDQYIGKVVDGQTNAPLEQVLVTAQPSKGDAVKTFTDNLGEFSLPLKKNTTYLVSYSKAGFTEVTKTIKTGDGTHRTILGIQPMLDAYASVAVNLKGPAPEASKESAAPKLAAKTVKKAAAVTAKAAKTSAPAETGAIKETAEKPAAKTAKTIKGTAAKKAKSKADEDRATAVANSSTSKAAPDAKELIQKYAIQVEAYEVGGKSINMSKYKDLFAFGNVYSRPTKKYVKIRVGVYDSADDAKKYLKDIKKLGFKQAFVTREYLHPTKEDRQLIVKAAPAPKPLEVAKKAPKAPAPKPAAPEKTKPAKAQRQYYIQLAAYKNPKYFPRKKVEPLGKIVRRKSGKYVVMYLTGFDSLEEAIEARRKAIEIGFRRPRIVYKKNGKFVLMRF